MTNTTETVEKARLYLDTEDAQEGRALLGKLIGFSLPGRLRGEMERLHRDSGPQAHPGGPGGGLHLRYVKPIHPRRNLTPHRFNSLDIRHIACNDKTVATVLFDLLKFNSGPLCIPIHDDHLLRAPSSGGTARWSTASDDDVP